jgi:ligand-binding sensor domain-containing protein
LKNAYSGAVVVKTTDFGTTWTDISSDLPKVPVNDIFIDGDNAGVIYLGNDFGVYRTTNNGGNWERMNNGMPFVPMLDFNLFSFDNTRLLRVATYGRGVFELDLEGFTSVNEAISGAATIQAWPNPASDVLWVEILATLPDTYTLAIVSMSGMEVASKTLFNSGAKFRTSMDISQLKPGSYQLVLKGGHLLKTCKVMIVNVSIY